MAKAKWIGGALGLLSGGPIGALAGFVLGSLFDNLIDEAPMMGGQQGFGQDNYQQDYRGNSYGYSSDRARRAAHVNQEARNGFLFSLLTLMSYIIKADGKIMHSEMDAARNFLRTNFGPVAAVEGEQIMLKLFERQKQEELSAPGSYRQTIINCCYQLRASVGAAELLQILNLLALLVKADGVVATEEINALRDITIALGLSEAEMNSMLNLGSTTLEQAYAVLEIQPSATDDEVRAAYKRLVLKHHPDRMAQLGEDVLAAAERKMKEINEAKDLIYKHRGMS
ncbi:MAG: TerB family tellurite resistance protein [Bacteroidaceae bacterium]|nr:TerB family tellurite resistance protein [Bacteroidaceae bacterium]